MLASKSVDISSTEEVSPQNIKNIKNKTIVLKWTKNSSDWMILAQGMKLLEKLSKSDKSLKLKLIEVAKRLKNDERKVVRTKAQKILEVN